MKKETSERYQKARQMYELGMSKDEIADAIGIKPNSVSKILYIAGVRKQENDTSERDERIRQMFQDGMRLKEIAEATGYSTSLIWEVINNKGRYRIKPGEFIERIEEPDLLECSFAEPRKPLEHFVIGGKSYTDITPLFGR